jgi:hypothetical protein
MAVGEDDRFLYLASLRVMDLDLCLVRDDVALPLP